MIKSLITMILVYFIIRIAAGPIMHMAMEYTVQRPATAKSAAETVVKQLPAAIEQAKRVQDAIGPTIVNGITQAIDTAAAQLKTTGRIQGAQVLDGPAAAPEQTEAPVDQPQPEEQGTFKHFNFPQPTVGASSERR